MTHEEFIRRRDILVERLRTKSRECEIRPGYEERDWIKRRLYGDYADLVANLQDCAAALEMGDELQSRASSIDCEYYDKDCAEGLCGVTAPMDNVGECLIDFFEYVVDPEGYCV